MVLVHPTTNLRRNHLAERKKESWGGGEEGKGEKKKENIYSTVLTVAFMCSLKKSISTSSSSLILSIVSSLM